MFRFGNPGVSLLAFCCLVFAQGCGESGNEPLAPTPAAIEVEPASLELFVGESRELSATAYDSAGDELAVQVVWATLTPSVASVSAAGVVAGLSPGNATVRASAGGVTGDIAITVNEVPSDPPSAIVVEPASLELEVGESGDISATVFDSAGQELQTLVTWESLHPLVASVNTAGRVTGLSVGSADVVASAGDVTADAVITVRAPDVDLGVYGRCPVLFVHGSGLSSQSFEGMIEFLEQDGYPPEYLHAVDLVPSNGANRTAASQAIEPAVEGILEAARTAAAQVGHPTSHIEKVCIVAHSMGAASSRWYLANLRPDRVVVWISIAGSNHGTDALEGIPGEGNLEMVPAFAESVDESSFQVELNGTSQAPADESPFGLGVDPEGVPSIPPDEENGIAYFTIRIDPDEWIKPEASALLAGAGGLSVDMPPGLPIEETSSGNYLADVATIHDGLPYDPSIQTLVASLLRVADE